MFDVYVYTPNPFHIVGGLLITSSRNISVLVWLLLYSLSMDDIRWFYNDRVLLCFDFFCVSEVYLN